MINFANEQGLGDVPDEQLFAGNHLSRLRGTPRYERGLMRFAEALNGVVTGKISRDYFTSILENQDSSQFQFYMGDILQRETYMKYERMRGEWRGYVREDMTIRDFRKVGRYWMYGGNTVAPFLQENEQYSYDGVAGTKVEYQVAKYGKLFGLSWEAVINDDLMLLRDLPMRLSESAVNTEDNFVTRLYADSNGPLSSIFSTDGSSNSGVMGTGVTNRLRANADLGTANDNAISIDAIRAAIHQMKTQVESEGDDDLPLRMDNFHLVIPNRYNGIINFWWDAREIRTKSNTIGAGGNEHEFVQMNTVPGMVTVHVNPWLDIIDGSDTTAWYLFANPGNTRPGVEIGYLRGHTRPEIWMRAPDSVSINGGGSGSMNGSFLTDQMDYKLRGVFGGTVIDPRMMLASLGTG